MQEKNNLILIFDDMSETSHKEDVSKLACSLRPKMKTKLCVINTKMDSCIDVEKSWKKYNNITGDEGIYFVHIFENIINKAISQNKIDPKDFCLFHFIYDIYKPRKELFNTSQTKSIMWSDIENMGKLELLDNICEGKIFVKPKVLGFPSIGKIIPEMHHKISESDFYEEMEENERIGFINE